MRRIDVDKSRREAAIGDTFTENGVRLVKLRGVSVNAEAVEAGRILVVDGVACRPDGSPIEQKGLQWEPQVLIRAGSQTGKTWRAP